MRTFIKGSALLLTAMISANATAQPPQDPNKSAIEARNGEMELRSFYAGPLFAMAKGQMDYSAEEAAKLANALKLLSQLPSDRMWPQGSDIDAYPELSTAKANIWTTYPEIAKYGEKYQNAVNELAAEAGNGLPALRSKIGALGKSCKGCHDEFRQKD